MHFLWGGGFADEWVNDKSHCWLFKFFFFPSLPSSAAEQDGMREGEGQLGTEKLRSTKPFWPLKNISGKPGSTGWGRSSLQGGAPASDVTPRQASPSKPPLFIIWEWDKEKRGVCQRRAPSTYSPREGCLPCERLERNQETEKQTEKWKSRSPSPPEALNLPFFSFLWYLWKLLLRHTEKGFCQKPSPQMSSDPSGGISAPNTAVTFSPPL